MGKFGSILGIGHIICYHNYQLLDTMWGGFQGPLRFPLDSNRLLSSPLAGELLEIETPVYGIVGQQRYQRKHTPAPLNWGTVYRYITY
jgi:hypothetical protein